MIEYIFYNTNFIWIAGSAIFVYFISMMLLFYTYTELAPWYALGITILIEAALYLVLGFFSGGLG